MRTYAFIFVCQAGELEIKAALLACSLRRYLAVEHELIAAIPGPASRWGTPGAATLALLEKLGVRTVPTGNEVDPTYPIANKIDCLRVPTTADKLVFLDSDMLLLREFRDDARFDVAFNARPASNPTFPADDAQWRTVYDACGVTMRPGRVRATYGGTIMPPYFNAAFIAVPGNSRFGDAWLDCCRRIDAAPEIPAKRPYLDQIALGVAAAKLGMAMDCLDETYNHPINLKPLDEQRLPIVCHYHDAKTLLREPVAANVARTLASEHPELRDLFSTSPAYQPLAAPRPKTVGPLPGATPELIITGIPRSGTSYLCNLLHRYDNCVILNEPPEIAQSLDEHHLPYGVPRFYRDVRRDVLAGVPIRNKLVDGKVTEDTTISNEFQLYSPKVAGADFVLGAKTTVAFLSRLPFVRRVMPGAKIVACVRDPLDALASWKTTFDHLRTADVSAVRIGNPDDPWLSGVHRAELRKIAAIPEVAYRRAAWWRYMAELVLEQQDHLIVVRYEDLVLRPSETVARVLGDWPAGRLREPIEPSVVRRKVEALDADDVQAVRSLCAEAAAALGIYRVDP